MISIAEMDPMDHDIKTEPVDDYYNEVKVVPVDNDQPQPKEPEVRRPRGRPSKLATVFKKQEPPRDSDVEVLAHRLSKNPFQDFEHDEEGRLLSCGLAVTLCDCQNHACPGCYWPCVNCGGKMCSAICQKGRKFAICTSDDGSGIVKNPYIPESYYEEIEKEKEKKKIEEETIKIEDDSSSESNNNEEKIVPVDKGYCDVKNEPVDNDNDE